MLYSSIIFAQTRDSVYIEPLKISPYIQELKINFESTSHEFTGYVLVKNTSDNIVYFTTTGGGCHLLPYGMMKYTEQGEPGLELSPHDSSYYYIHGWRPHPLIKDLNAGYGDITRQYCSILDTMRNETIFARASFCTHFKIFYYNVDSCKYIYKLISFFAMGLFLKKEYLVDYQFFYNAPRVKSYNDLIRREDE